jgi:cytochrome c5
MKRGIYLLVSLVLSTGGALVHSATTEEMKETRVFETQCSQCHSISKAQEAHVIESEVRTGAPRIVGGPDVRIKRQDYDHEEDYLLAYITEERHGGVFFGECARCHTMGKSTARVKRSEKVAGTVRVAKRSTAELTEERAVNIEDYLLHYITREKENLHQALFESKCARCHKSESVGAGHIHKERARGVVEEMAKEFEKEINPEDFDNIEDYLLEYIKR